MRKAIFIDIDGTLRNSKKEVTDYTAKIIKKAVDNNYLIVICSARPRLYTADVSKKANASQYIIASNGGDIYDYKEQKVMYEEPIDNEDVIKLYNIAIKSGACIDMDTGDLRYTNRIRHEDREVLLEEPIEEFLKNHEVIQCVINDPDDKKISGVIPEIESIQGVEIKNRTKYLIDNTVERPPNFFCDVAKKTINKGTGIEHLCKILNIDKDDTIAIGDGFNDLFMFEKVGYKVAMQNSIAEVIKNADQIIHSNDEDGVALFLEELMSKGFILY